VSLAHDLLEQAQHLAKRERGRPRQASLRRAISAAYYALFHLLLEEAALQAIPGSLASWRPVSARSINHGDVKKVANGFVRGALPTPLTLDFPYRRTFVWSLGLLANSSKLVIKQTTI
jgi:hypothetical protein